MDLKQNRGELTLLSNISIMERFSKIVKGLHRRHLETYQTSMMELFGDNS